MNRLRNRTTPSPAATLRTIRSRTGASLVFMVIVIPVVLILTGFVIDLSRVFLVKNQLQASADAGALGGAALMRHPGIELETYSFSLAEADLQELRPVVQSVVAANSAGHLGPHYAASLRVDANSGNGATGDIVLGHYLPEAGFIPRDAEVNAVKVVTRFAAGHANGKLPLLFGNLLKQRAVGLNATAVAKIERPTLLPFVVYEPQWDALRAGYGSDDFAVNPATGGVTAGADGINEMKVFPADWEDLEMPPGNAGWFDLGDSSATGDLRRQIDQGPSTAEMNRFGGVLRAGDSVAGMPGLRASAEIAFTGGSAEKRYEGIIGKPRVIPLFDQVSGQGANARYRITKFVLVRVVQANLSGSPRGIVIQPLGRKDEAHRVTLVQ